MNPEAQSKLDEILALEPAALTEEDHAFLMARRDYLTEDQREMYDLNEKAAKSLTKAELQEELTARGIEFKPTDKVADLQALLDAAPANQE